MSKIRKSDIVGLGFIGGFLGMLFFSIAFAGSIFYLISTHDIPWHATNINRSGVSRYKTESVTLKQARLNAIKHEKETGGSK